MKTVFDYKIIALMDVSFAEKEINNLALEGYRVISTVAKKDSPCIVWTLEREVKVSSQPH